MLSTRGNVALGAIVCALLCGESDAQEKPVLHLPSSDPAELRTPGQQLQDAVNNPAIAGTVIALGAGTYTLDPTRPNGGKLVLQQAVDIVGENQYVDVELDGVWDHLVAGTETLIDGTQVAGSGAGVIRGGRANRIARVTVRAPGGAATVAGSSIDLTLAPPAPGSISATVEDTIVENGLRGIRINSGGRNDMLPTVTLQRNIVRNIPRVPGLLSSGFGIQLQSGGTNTAWTLILRQNRVEGAVMGLFAVGNSSTQVVTEVDSSRNLFTGCDVGVVVAAGFDGGGTTSATGNSLTFTSVHDRLIDNAGADAPTLDFLGLAGGLVALASSRDNAASLASNDHHVRLTLLHAELRGNSQGGAPRDITVMASHVTKTSASGDAPLGSGNLVEVLIRKTRALSGAGSFVVADNSNPLGETADNHVLVLGSDVAFQLTNEGF